MKPTGSGAGAPNSTGFGGTGARGREGFRGGCIPCSTIRLAPDLPPSGGALKTYVVQPLPST
jgi:hypothetical protein